MTLGSWFRDYLYIPLGGNRKGNVYVNLLIVFLCTGLWHGANYTFAIWGLWHGIFIVAERMIKSKKPGIKIPVVLSQAYTLFVVLIGWVMFRAPGLGSALRYIKAMFGIQKLDTFLYYNIWYFIDIQILFTILVGAIISMGIPGKLLSKLDLKTNPKLLTAKYVCLAVLFVISGSMIMNGNFSPFIYFRF